MEAGRVALADEGGERGSALEVLAVATRLGLTSFGGPVAHLGYFREEYVVRRRWLDERVYADLLALCHFLPGPASSQLGIAIGALRAGRLGALAAWLGFTLPSAALLVVFAYGVGEVDPEAGWLHGLGLVAVAVVSAAVVGMARMLTPDVPRAALAVAAAGVALAWEGVGGQVVTLVAAGVVGWLGFRRFVQPADAGAPCRGSRRAGALALGAFALLLVTLPLVRAATDAYAVALVDSFYRAGSLVFGGGHVVLPLLHAEVVPPGWVSDAEFVAGYGAAQAVPGPLFTFAAYLGAVAGPDPNGVAGGVLALGAVFLPSFLLVGGLLPFWAWVRARPAARAALLGINAAVVGLLVAALYDPVWTTSIDSVADAAVAGALFAMLVFGRVPAWLVVAAGAAAGAASSALGAA